MLFHGNTRCCCTSLKQVKWFDVDANEKLQHAPRRNNFIMFIALAQGTWQRAHWCCHTVPIPHFQQPRHFAREKPVLTLCHGTRHWQANFASALQELYQ